MAVVSNRKSTPLTAATIEQHGEQDRRPSYPGRAFGARGFPGEGKVADTVRGQGSQEAPSECVSVEQAQHKQRDGMAAEFAERYGISSKAVRDIWNLRTWTTVTKPYWTQEDEALHRRKMIRRVLKNDHPALCPIGSKASSGNGTNDTTRHESLPTKRHVENETWSASAAWPIKPDVPAANKDRFGIADFSCASNGSELPDLGGPIQAGYNNMGLARDPPFPRKFPSSFTDPFTSFCASADAPSAAAVPASPNPQERTGTFAGQSHGQTRYFPDAPTCDGSHLRDIRIACMRYDLALRGLQPSEPCDQTPGGLDPQVYPNAQGEASLLSCRHPPREAIRGRPVGCVTAADNVMTVSLVSSWHGESCAQGVGGAQGAGAPFASDIKTSPPVLASSSVLPCLAGGMRETHDDVGCLPSYVNWGGLVGPPPTKLVLRDGEVVLPRCSDEVR